MTAIRLVWPLHRSFTNCRHRYLLINDESAACTPSVDRTETGASFRNSASTYVEVRIRKSTSPISQRRDLETKKISIFVSYFSSPPFGSGEDLPHTSFALACTRRGNAIRAWSCCGVSKTRFLLKTGDAMRYPV